MEKTVQQEQLELKIKSLELTKNSVVAKMLRLKSQGEDLDRKISSLKEKLKELNQPQAQKSESTNKQVELGHSNQFSNSRAV